jgi:hypothetical protein
MNGLRQRNVAGQDLLVYRQRNPRVALEAIGVTGGQVQQCMTHDGTILFAAKEDADRAFELLEQCRLSDGHKVFFVERQEPLRVFYQLAFEHKVDPGTSIVCGNRSLAFFDLFQIVCERTGEHVPDGDVFYDGIAMPARMQNHEVYHHVLSYFREAAVAEHSLRQA